MRFISFCDFQLILANDKEYSRDSLTSICLVMNSLAAIALWLLFSWNAEQLYVYVLIKSQIIKLFAFKS